MIPLNDDRLKNDVQFRNLVELAIKDPLGVQKRVRAARCATPGGLMRFIRLMWEYVEPTRDFREGWHLDAICEHLEAVTRGEITRLLINVPPGFCKALDDDELIFTTWGWKRHGDLCHDDFVYGIDGLPKRVLAVTPPRTEECYRVVFDDEAGVVAGAGHLWAVERDVMSVAPHYRRGRKAMVVPTTELRMTDPQGSWTRRPDRIAMAAPVFMPPKRLLIDPYLLGVWLGDGNTTGAMIYAGEQDAEHFLQFGRASQIVEPGKGRKQRFFHILVDGLQTKLRLSGLLGNKHIPADYLEASIDQRWELLRGLMDTDGTCAKQGYCSYVTKLLPLAKQIQLLTRSLGLKSSLRIRYSNFNGERFGPYHEVGFTPPEGSVVFKLARKQERVAAPQNSRSRCRYVERLDPVGPRSVRCIQVEGGLYLAGAGLVPTHNSLITNVFWPAWEWGPKKMPSMRYLTVSYSQDLTIRDNVRFRQVITSDRYQEHWGEYVSPSKDQFSLVKVGNTKTGWKLASSVGGIGTGERGDRVICFPYDTLITTAAGPIPIGRIVNERIAVAVAGWDGERTVWQDIQEYQESSADELVEIEFDGGVLLATVEHPIWVVGRGWTEAGDVVVGDEMSGHIVSAVSRSACSPTPVFNLAVTPEHNYFANGVLVHNCDDPNSVKDVESDKVRDSTNQYLTEVLPTRINSPAESAIVIIQQRTHEDDASGTVLSRDMGYEHLMIPMEYDSGRRFVTSIGWTDPRGVDAEGNETDADGTLAWPEFYPLGIVDQLKKDLGPYATAGQLQQMPAPRGGAIFERDWWRAWDIDSDAKIRFPQFEYVVASVDTAFTDKEVNDYSAMVVLGVYRDTGTSTLMPRNLTDPTETLRVAQDQRPKVMLMWGWQKRLSLHGPPEERPWGVTDVEWNSPAWLPERQKQWGLVEWVVYTAKRYKIDHLLIETQAAGHSLEQELRRLHSTGDWGIQLINARGDKTARAYAVQHLFSNGLVYAPFYPDSGSPPAWAGVIIDQMSSFPKKREKDLVDATTHALQHLRDIGILVRGEEHDADFTELMRPPKKKTALYEV